MIGPEILDVAAAETRHTQVGEPRQVTPATDLPVVSTLSLHESMKLLEKTRKKQRTAARNPRRFDARRIENLDADTPEEAPQRGMLSRLGLWDSVVNGRLLAYRRDPSQEGYKPRHMPEDAVIVGLPNNDGKPVAYKYFSDETDDGSFLGQAGWSPSWRSGDLRDPAIETEWIVKGELNGAAVNAALMAAGVDHHAVQGLSTHDPIPECLHDMKGRRAILITDDAEHRREWTALMQAAGARVHILSEGVFRQDTAAQTACDALRAAGAAELGRLLVTAASQADEVPLPEPVPLPVHEYTEENGCIMRHYEDSRGNPRVDRLALFVARIEQDVKCIDHRGQVIHEYRISGVSADGKALPVLTVPARDFKAMQWLSEWGSKAVVMAGPGRLDHMRTAIQLLSKSTVQETVVYRRTGWTEWEGQPIFLTQGQALSAEGPVQDVEADLREGFTHYRLPVPDADSTEAVRASFALTKIAPDILAIPLLAMTYRPVIGIPRYLLLIVGKSGHGKTTYIAQFQSHFGSGWNADRLPASWMSTGMSILEQASIAKNVMFAVDDVKFNASVRENEKIKENLNRLINAVGDRKGRSRLNRDATEVSTTPPPGGAIVVSGESALLPFSDAARTVLVQDETDLLTSPESAKLLEEASILAAQGIYARSMSSFVQWIARHHANLTDDAFRTQFVYPLRTKLGGPGGHARTPDNLADILACWQVMLTFALDIGALSATEIQGYWQRAVNVVLRLLGSQADVLRQADPVDAFLGFLTSLLRSKEVYLTDLAHGGPPEVPEKWGWVASGGGHDGQDTVWTTGRTGRAVGYFGKIHPDGPSYVMLDPAFTYKQVAELAEHNHTFLPDPKTLWRLLKERFAEDGYMLHEVGKNGHRRKVPGDSEAKGKRPSLLHLHEDVFAEDRDVGDIGTETPATSLSSDFPFVPVLPELVTLFPSHPGTPQENTESEVPPANPGDRPFRQYLI